MRHLREQLTPKQRRNPVYAADSSHWEAWFAWEHEEQRRHGVRDVVARPQPPLVVHEEDQEVEAAYQNALAAVLRASEEETFLKEEEEAYQKHLAEATALSAADDAVMPPLAQPFPAETRRLVLKPEMYVWDGVVRELVSPPPFSLVATPE
ncbi:hypothetical protein D1007_11911 [Hordeum vulgare]|nr:hypothetical protein D1007_11911 [Hordeum vulgare]